jgi:hypothetical protein
VAFAQEPSPAPAPASTPPVAFGADEVRFEARAQALEITGHVHVDEPPFHLASDALALRRVPIGAELAGKGTLAFCPCLGTPLAVHFTGATVAPPHDVILRNPVLDVFGVPVAWAPVFWLRDGSRFGVLPPNVEWRGADGLFLGDGVHVPWVKGDATRGLDLEAGAYVDGGVATGASLRTATTQTSVRWDELHGDDGIGIAARGATSTVAWAADALRGPRAVRATTDLDAAARAFDRAEAEASWRTGGWTFASGVRDVALRGGDLADLGAGGPVIAARRADALGGVGAYDATLEGGGVTAAGLGTTTFARVEGGGTIAGRVGPAGATLDVRGVGDVVDDGTRSGSDGAGEARGTFGVPLVRGFSSGDGEDSWVHRTEPRVEVAGLVQHVSDVLAVPAGRGATAPGAGSWVAALGWSNAVGRQAARSAAELDASAGFVGDASEALPALRARASASSGALALRADFARVFGTVGTYGGAFVARARLGPANGLNVVAHVAERDGVDPVVARTLVDAPLEPASGFLIVSGWTGGARLAVPVGPRVTARGGADVDLDAPGGAQLVAAAGALELHDPCGCVVVRASVAHRIGREGVDAWVTVDLPR